ncbi:MAG: CopG family transcriptional regulator [Acidimicrobiales bacterium]|nr:MAG: CopG family transcriptional regulator [Acidimicrobiales bacterium]
MLSLDYSVAISHPISIRFRDDRIVDRLKAEAGARGHSTSAMAEELIDEGLRVRRHPLVTFRDGPSGRRAALVGGPDVWEAISGVVGGDVPGSERVERAIELFCFRREQVQAALAYYAEFTEEIDAQVTTNLAVADEAEDLWRRQQDLLAG